MNIKKQNIVFISILAVLLAGLLGAHFWYESKCAKFQDKNIENLHILDLCRNPFTDISPLQNLKHLEAVKLCWVPVENLEILTKIPSLKLVMYEPASQEEEVILQKLESQGVTVYREASNDWWLWTRQREKKTTSHSNVSSS